MAIVTATNLSKVFDNKLIAVDNISFEIKKGTVFGFLGPNGAGKSTTIKMMTGLLSPSSGTLELFGKQLTQEDIKSHMGYIPQELIFFNHLTVEENAILFANSYRLSNIKSRIDEVFNLLGLREIRHQQASNLSGGQKRRLNVALGILHSPKILIMDEPSAGMDPQSRNILWETIQKLSTKDITIILTTHLMEVVEKLADEICIIDHGKILVQGTISEIKKQFGAQEIIDVMYSPDENGSLEMRIQDLLTSTFSENDVMQRKGVYSIKSNNGLVAVQQIMETLQPIGLEKIDQIIARHHSLEDIFISLTGRDLRE